MCALLSHQPCTYAHTAHAREFVFHRRDEIFLHLFEQYGDVTFLVLLCGYKGNGKSLRTERAMAVFPKDWVVAGGPSSAKSGMNGQSDSTNGKNIIYDEMVDDLCDADGSDRLEYCELLPLP